MGDLPNVSPSATIDFEQSEIHHHNLPCKMAKGSYVHRFRSLVFGVIYVDNNFYTTILSHPAIPFFFLHISYTEIKMFSSLIIGVFTI